MSQNLSVPNSVRSVAGISAQSTGALTELKKLKFVFGIQIVYFSEILRAKYPKLEYWSDENPSVITSRWRKRHFGITLFENTNFSTFKFSFKIPKTPPKIGTFQNQKTRGGENGMVFPGGENGISLILVQKVDFGPLSKGKYSGPKSPFRSNSYTWLELLQTLFGTKKQDPT